MQVPFDFDRFAISAQGRLSTPLGPDSDQASLRMTAAFILRTLETGP
jgi:hypothetical protein